MQIDLSVDFAGHLVATADDGPLLIENGLLMTSTQLDASRNSPINLGLLVDGVYSFHFSSLADSIDHIVASNSGSILWQKSSPGLLSDLAGDLDDDLAAVFWANFTQARFDTAFSASLGPWIEANMVGLEVYALTALCTGLTLAFLLEAGAATVDLLSETISAMAKEEAKEGILSESELALIISWAKRGSLVTKLLPISLEASILQRAIALIPAFVNYTAESSTVKLTVSLSADALKKYMLVITLLPK